MTDDEKFNAPTGRMSEPFSIDPADLEGSLLGEVLKGARDAEGVYVAPLLGVNFVEPWQIFGTDNA